ncbi:MAG: glycosyltransferase family 4 protein [Candidatus Magasanikbacteria bacterium]|nr:glycosyltransferase family 4 protein [Candidatus Magasanikbacteria bacterium]
MKVCLINNLYPPFARGGAEQVVDKTVHGLVDHGAEVVVITSTPQRPERLTAGALTIYRIHPPNFFFYTAARQYSFFLRLLWHGVDMFHYPAARAVRAILRHENPDIVHTHNLMGISFLVPRLVRRLGLRHLHTVHDVQLVEPSGIILKKKENDWRYTGLSTQAYTALMKGLMGSPEAIISPSQFLLDFYAVRGFFPASTKVMLRNPISLPAVRRRGATAAELRFLYLGQIEEHKGVLFLAESFRRLLVRYPDLECSLHIAGSGSASERLAALAADCPRIVVHGRVEREALPELFAAADVTIVPSLCYENSPTVIFESFSFGVPVVASRVEGIAELIREGENGFTFKTEDSSALIERLLWCVRERAKLARMGSIACAGVQDLSLTTYINTLTELYRGDRT